MGIIIHYVLLDIFTIKMIVDLILMSFYSDFEI